MRPTADPAAQYLDHQAQQQRRAA